ncbi:MAG: protein translocase subunit SecD [Planctomycetota bacterium]
METLLSFIPFLAQTAAPAIPATEWWRETWFSWLLTVATVVVPTFIAWLLAKQFRVGDLWARLAAVLVATAAGAVVVALGWPPRLGIDLKGGVILVYEVDRSKQVAGRVDECVGRVQQLVARREGAGVSRTADGRIAVRPGTADAASRQALVDDISALDLADTTLVPLPARSAGDELVFEVRGRTDPVDMDKLVAAVSRRVKPGGPKEVTVRRFGLDQIEVIVPEVDQAEVDLIKRIVSSAGVLEFRITANPDDPRHGRIIELSRTPGTTVLEGTNQLGRWIRLDTAQLEPQGLVTRPGTDGTTEVLVILDRFNVNGGYLVRAMSSLDQSLQPCVNFAFNPAGSTLFGALTGNNLPDPANRLESRLGIVLDDVLLSAPRIREAISGNGQITGDFKKADLDFLVGVLNAGSLPAALVSEPISEQKISPQLGADTIRSGAMAMIVATALVLLFMLLYYRFAGFVADVAVLLNILLVLAVMISIKAAFTLAGLAGLVLSVGMAVDANVLIYERMREEQQRGASLRTSIRNGFQRAFSTIVDSTLTTLITGLVLFAIGTDQLKGFAVTLILGLTLNLFTAVFCSRVLFDLAERCHWIRRLSMARIFGETKFPFVAWMRPAIITSTAFILLGLLAAWQRGQGLFDIDFTGGTSVQVEFKPDQPLPIAAVRDAVASLPDAAVSAISTPGAAPDLRYKIDTSLRGSGPGEVEARIRELFAGRLATYGMEILDVTSKVRPAAEGAAADAAAAERSTTTASLRFPQKISRATLREAVQAALVAAKIGDADFEVSSADAAAAAGRGAGEWTMTTTLDADSTRGVLDAVKGTLSDTPVWLAANTIGGKVAGNTKVTAVYALLASLLMIVLYVWIRFQNVAFGVAAVIALAHDVLVAVACLALSTYVAPYLGWALVDDFKISLDVVAALLTIIGFSINDTIVIFDRLRELRGKARFVTADMVDRAVNQTLSRTVLTSGTALLATLILYAIGGQGIHAFAFTMLVGILVGTYSTIYIASPLVLWLQHFFAGGEQPVASRAAARPA